MHVEQVDFISIPTRNVERAVAWYRDVLGLPESDVTKGEMETPNVTLSFWEPERWDSGVCHFAAFRDPDGNTLILHRRYAARTPPPRR